MATGECPDCGGEQAAVEYTYDSPAHYDGVSEWQCMACGRREGRWTGRVLQEGEVEPPFGGDDA